MKILLVTRIWPSHRPGGMPHVAYDRAKALAQAGHEVVVATTSISRKPKGWVEPCKVVYLDSRPNVWSGGFTDAVRKLAEKDGSWDVIHSDSFDRDYPWFVGWRGADVQAVTMHGPKWGTWLTERNLAAIRAAGPPVFPSEEIMREQNALAAADRVLAISKWEFRMLRDHYRLPQTRLVYNPIGQMFFDAPRPRKRRRYFLSAAISGQRERVFAAARDACRTAGVEWLEVKDIPREKMPAVYDEAIALVNPTCYAQGYDLTVGEGRARGCPAILGATGSYLDEAETQRWDILVEPGDVAGVAEAIEQKLGDTRDFSEDMADFADLQHNPVFHASEWRDALRR